MTDVRLDDTDMWHFYSPAQVPLEKVIGGWKVRVARRKGLMAGSLVPSVLQSSSGRCCPEAKQPSVNETSPAGDEMGNLRSLGEVNGLVGYSSGGLR